MASLSSPVAPTNSADVTRAGWRRIHQGCRSEHIGLVRISQQDATALSRNVDDDISPPWRRWIRQTCAVVRRSRPGAGPGFRRNERSWRGMGRFRWRGCAGRIRQPFGPRNGQGRLDRPGRAPARSAPSDPAKPDSAAGSARTHWGGRSSTDGSHKAKATTTHPETPEDTSGQGTDSNSLRPQPSLRWQRRPPPHQSSRPVRSTIPLWSRRQGGAHIERPQLHRGMRRRPRHRCTPPSQSAQRRRRRRPRHRCTPPSQSAQRRRRRRPRHRCTPPSQSAQRPRRRQSRRRHVPPRRCPRSPGFWLCPHTSSTNCWG